MGATQGRFLSADPENAGADPSNPQSWNGYAYVNNNPLTLVDPSGLDPSDFGPGGDPDPCEDDPIFCGGWGWPPFFPIGGRPGEPRPPVVPPPPPIPVTIFGLPNNTGGVYDQGQWGSLPRLSGFGPNLPCDFGDCSTGIGALNFAEDHHIFPQQFRQWFLQHGIDVDAFILSLERGVHRLKPNGIHTKSGGNWNAVWKKWIADHPKATLKEIMDQAKKMLTDFGIGGTGVFPDIFIIVNPCITSPSLPFCGDQTGPA